jgi:hypothetical protein
VSDFLETDGRLDLPELWRLLEDLEEGAPDPARCDELTALLNRSPAARRAYLEYFQQSAVLRLEAAKLHERGLLPVAGSADQTRRIFQRSMLAAAALVALAAVVAALVVVARPDPARLAAAVAPQTRWSIDGVPQASADDPVGVAEGAVIEVLSGTVRLELETGELMVIQGPAELAFPGLRHPQLRRGWLWIDAGKSDEPFRVAASGLRIRDIGTRFGVRASANGRVEVHLVSGRVEVRDPKRGTLLGDLEGAGKAFEFTNAGKVAELPLAADPFPDLPGLLARPADYRSTVLGQSPVGYWPLDEADRGPLANEVRGSSVGVLGEKVRAGRSGVGPADGFRGFPEGNRALLVEGSAARSAVVGLDGLHGVQRREGAVSFWIHPEAGRPPRAEVLWLAGFGDGKMIVPSEAILHTRLTVEGRVIFEIENGDADVRLSSSRSIADGGWHHVVASWGASSIDLYVDGRLVGRDSGPRTLGKAHLRGRFVRFGKPSVDQHPRFSSYTGRVDEIALWDRPLTPAEVAAQHRAAVGRAEFSGAR